MSTTLTSPVHLECSIRIIIRQHNQYHSEKALDYEYKYNYYKYYTEALVLLIEFTDFYGYFKKKCNYIQHDGYLNQD